MKIENPRNLRDARAREKERKKEKIEMEIRERRSETLKSELYLILENKNGKRRVSLR